MNTAVKIAGMVVVAVAIVAGGYFAGAQVSQAQAAAPDVMAYGQGGGFGPGQGQGGYGMHNGPRNGGAGQGILADYHDQMRAAVAQALGVSVEELDQALKSGQTAWQIAEEKGIDAEQFRAAMLEARADVLAQAVQDGKLTQEQADTMLERLQEHMGQGYGFGMGNCPQQ